MAEVIWTLQAINDIDNIAIFIANDSERYAGIQTNRFLQATIILEENPKFGRIVPELKNPDVREIILGNYRLIYRIVNSKQIHILTIHHSKRLLSNNLIFRKEE